jgi:hypothetical protein
MKGRGQNNLFGGNTLKPRYKAVANTVISEILDAYSEHSEKREEADNGSI